MGLGLREHLGQADWIHLTSDEHVHWSGRPSRYTLVPAMTIMTVLAAVGIAMAIWSRPLFLDRGWPLTWSYLPLVLVLIGVSYGLIAYLRWLRLLYVITEEEIYVKIGLISRDVTQVPLDRVQNSSYTQSVLERFLSYGTIYVYTAGTHTDDVVLRNVPKPRNIKEILTLQLSEAHGPHRRMYDGT